MFQSIHASHSANSAAAEPAKREGGSYERNVGRHDYTSLPPTYNRQAVNDKEETHASKESFSLKYIMKGSVLFHSLSDGFPHDGHKGM